MLASNIWCATELNSAARVTLYGCDASFFFFFLYRDVFLLLVVSRHFVAALFER